MRKLQFEKKEVVKLFGNLTETGKPIGVSPSAVHQWPEVLSHKLSLQIIGAAVITGKRIPKEWFKGERNE